MSPVCWTLSVFREQLRAEGSRQKAEGSRQQAEGSKQKAASRKQKAESSKPTLHLGFASCLLLTAFYFLPYRKSQSLLNRISLGRGPRRRRQRSRSRRDPG